MTEYRVIKNRKSDSDNPIIVREGDKVICGEESDEAGDWAGWVSCSTETNVGWIPKQIVDRSGDSGIILEDYDALEFDIEVDEIIIMEKTLNGWIWGYKKNNSLIKAWTPLNHLVEA